MDEYIGPRLIPDDGKIADFVINLICENEKILSRVMTELFDTIAETDHEGQPLEFAYAKLLNFLNAQDNPLLIYLCAAALWKLWEDGWNINQSN